MNPDYLDTKKFKDNFEKLVNFLEGKRVVLFGGEDLEFIKSKCDLSRLNILGIFDSHFEEKHFNRYYQGFKILSENLVKALNPDYMLDMSLDRFTFAFKYYWFENIKILSVFADINKPSLMYLEYHITDHCNLNCKSCDNFAPLVSKEVYAGVNEFEDNIKELSKKFDIYSFTFLGGEPLLHKDINKFLTISRKYLPLSDIKIITNGILLPKMNDDFFLCCKENKIVIDITYYPPFKNQINEYLDILNKFKIQNNIEKRFYLYNISLKESPSNNSIKNIRNHCIEKYCLSLRNSKLYSCDIECYIHYFNKHFNKNLPQSDGIDFYKNNAETILKEIDKGCELCKYCGMVDFDFSLPWSISKKDISEWFKE